MGTAPSGAEFDLSQLTKNDLRSHAEIFRARKRGDGCHLKYSPKLVSVTNEDSATRFYYNPWEDNYYSYYIDDDYTGLAFSSGVGQLRSFNDIHRYKDIGLGIYDWVDVPDGGAGLYWFVETSEASPNFGQTMVRFATTDDEYPFDTFYFEDRIFRQNEKSALGYTSYPASVNRATMPNKAKYAARIKKVYTYTTGNGTFSHNRSYYVFYDYGSKKAYWCARRLDKVRILLKRKRIYMSKIDVTYNFSIADRLYNEIPVIQTVGSTPFIITSPTIGVLPALSYPEMTVNDFGNYTDAGLEARFPGFWSVPNHASQFLSAQAGFQSIVPSADGTFPASWSGFRRWWFAWWHAYCGLRRSGFNDSPPAWFDAIQYLYDDPAHTIPSYTPEQEHDCLSGSYLYRTETIYWYTNITLMSGIQTLFENNSGRSFSSTRHYLFHPDASTGTPSMPTATEAPHQTFANRVLGWPIEALEPLTRWAYSGPTIADYTDTELSMWFGQGCHGYGFGDYPCFHNSETGVWGDLYFQQQNESWMADGKVTDTTGLNTWGIVEYTVPERVIQEGVTEANKSMQPVWPSSWGITSFFAPWEIVKVTSIKKAEKAIRYIRRAEYRGSPTFGKDRIDVKKYQTGDIFRMDRLRKKNVPVYAGFDYSRMRPKVDNSNPFDVEYKTVELMP